MSSHTLICICFIALLAFTSAYRVDPNAITTSGLSAGGFMAVQFQFAYSARVKGAGVLAGGHFYCAQGSHTTAQTACMAAPILLDVNKLITTTDNLAKQNKIDDPSNLKKSKVYLFSGKKDTVVNPQVMQKCRDYYLHYVDSANIKTEFSLDAEHTFPTLDFGNACTTRASPYIGKCSYDGAGTVLNWLYDGLKPKTSAISSNIKSIKQDPVSGLASTAYYYLPTGCANNKTDCKLHVAFHGCLQDTKTIQDKYYTKTGYNEWAEANNIIILYPQATSVILKNPNSCFDWWGYGSSSYVQKDAPQMKAVWKMIDSISS